MKKIKYLLEKENGKVVIKCKDTKITGFKNFSEARNFLQICKKINKKKFNIVFNVDK